MLCKIADLLTEIPEAGGMAPRCTEYLTDTKARADIVISADLYDETKWRRLSPENAIYMESGRQFYKHLLRFDGIMLHASAVALDGRGYLFSGPSGTGKSTHTRLWQQTFGSSAQVFNDDKPALRRLGGHWYAYGTPWCGKDGINQNMKVPLAGICFLKKAKENRITRLAYRDAMIKIISQTTYGLRDVENMDLMLRHVDMLVREIPVYEMENLPEPAAVRLSYETMLRGAKEIGL